MVQRKHYLQSFSLYLLCHLLSCHSPSVRMLKQAEKKGKRTFLQVSCLFIQEFHFRNFSSLYSNLQLLEKQGHCVFYFLASVLKEVKKRQLGPKCILCPTYQSYHSMLRSLAIMCLIYTPSKLQCIDETLRPAMWQSQYRHFYQGDNLSLIPETHREEGGEGNPTSCLLTSTCTLQHMCVCTHMQISINKQT